jgi:hypothetical protein
MSDIAQVEEILRKWDPIGISPGPGEDDGPMDEYDSYAPRLLALLQRGARVDDIHEQLVLIRTVSMGLDADPRDKRVAKELVSWWRAKAKS